MGRIKFTSAAVPVHKFGEFYNIFIALVDYMLT